METLKDVFGYGTAFYRLMESLQATSREVRETACQIKLHYLKLNEQNEKEVNPEKYADRYYVLVDEKTKCVSVKDREDDSIVYQWKATFVHTVHGTMLTEHELSAANAAKNRLNREAATKV